MAPVWGWLLAYLLGFLLFQAVVYWYLRDDGPSIEDPTPGYGDGDPPVAPPPDRPQREAAAGDSVRCPHCGASNERVPTYTYCRACAGELR